MSLATMMHHLNTPMIFNHEDWGFGSEELPETALPAPHGES